MINPSADQGLEISLCDVHLEDGQGLELRLACEEGLAQLQTASGSLPVAVQKGMETFDKQLTSVIYITGRSAH